MSADASETIVDDTILINAESRLEGSREFARSIVRNVPGPAAVKPAKDKR